jgi:hypothetical protein
MSFLTWVRRQATRPLRTRGVLFAALAVLLLAALTLLAARYSFDLVGDEHEPYRLLASTVDDEAASAAVDRIDRTGTWPRDVIKVLETLPHIRCFEARIAALDLLERRSGQQFRDDPSRWYLWYCETHPEPPHYDRFKAAMYGSLTSWGRKVPDLGEYFLNDPAATIRLDEVRWGGIERDGIPPLRHPKSIPAKEAGYLEPRDIVFGLVIEGQARAYPRRILEHHELFTDELGGESITGVFCPLCMAMVGYRSESGGRRHDLGTSGFLYNSNKLMYDRATKSLWYSVTGEPVVGPLVGKGLRLEALPVVTTTWSSWLGRHPDTTVLSLDTGYKWIREGDLLRNYSDGGNYGEYFSSPELMFDVARKDERLKAKDEVFVLRGAGADDAPVAIAQAFLARTPVYHLESGGVVIVTDDAGANRAFETGDRSFSRGRAEDELTDAQGRVWKVAEEGLVGEAGITLRRVCGHRVYWFAWFAAHPDTRLIR